MALRAILVLQRAPLLNSELGLMKSNSEEQIA